MLILFLLTFFSLAVSTADLYNPADHIGEVRVPTGCGLEPLSCPASWKSGITDGGSSSSPLIDIDFILCHEGLTKCGYVPIDPASGAVLGQSGVTIGGGVDLGSKDRAYLSSIGVETAVIDALEPYFGLKQGAAADAIINNPFSLTVEQARDDLTTRVKNSIVSSVETRYDNELTGDSLAFASLPRAMRTAVCDVWFQFGTPGAYPRFWGHVIRNDWEEAIGELEDFYTDPSIQQPGDLRRRQNEADIIRAVLEKCTRPVDVVFLLDQSGSIGSSDFSLALDFIRQIINAFPDSALSDEKGTRFGLSLFASSYEKAFSLSSYKSQQEYTDAIDAVSQSGGSTRLGSALSLIVASQFTEANGLRPATLGLPNILVVLTDGVASDSVEAPAMTVRDSSIVIYAIGIGGYDYDQLVAIASPSPPPHVYLLDAFSDLGDFASTLTASTCYESQPLSANTLIIGVVSEGEFHYYQFEVQGDRNLQIILIDILGHTFLFASRVTPHPYEYDNDLGFLISSDPRKQLVISPVSEDTGGIVRRNTHENMTYSIYVSVKGASSNNSFTLVGSLCDPANCTEGTYGSGASSLLLSMSVILLTFVFSLFII